MIVIFSSALLVVFALTVGVYSIFSSTCETENPRNLDTYLRTNSRIFEKLNLVSRELA